MDAIKIDFDVFKALTARRKSEDMTFNDVIRELLGLKNEHGNVVSARTESPSVNKKGALVFKGVVFPEGTKFRANYKGKIHNAEAKGGLMLLDDGNTVSSLSAAAMHITRTSVNGWRFWECQFPDKADWVLLDTVRFIQSDKGNL